jgi:cyclopropane fatty-acyl-phospholipid synthase-like methyltransferase
VTSGQARRPTPKHKQAGYERTMLGRLNRRRYEAVARLVHLQPTDRILDLGCGVGAKSVATHNRTNAILGIDRFPEKKLHRHGPNFQYERGDARELRGHADDEFDVVLSFGLLEHLADDADLRAVIREARRVGRRYAHVVPHRYGFIEPHYRLPFFALWPAPLKTLGLRMFHRKPAGSEHWRTVRWPSAAAWRELFDDPTLRVKRHWYGPVLMNYLLVGGEPSSGSAAASGDPGLQPADKDHAGNAPEDRAA